MLRGAIVLAAACAMGVAAAQVSAEGPGVVDPGTFAAIAVSAAAPTELVVAAPPGFSGPQRVTVAAERTVFYLHVGRSVVAGDHVVTLTDGEGRSTEVVVTVARRTGLVLVAPQDATVVRGEVVEHRIVLENTGNGTEEVKVSVQSRLLDSDLDLVVELEPGEARSVSLGAWPADTVGRDVAVVTATPASDPSQERFAVVRTEVLPFAGADEVTGPVMDYGIELTGGYGSAGYLAGLRVLLGGDLSGYVSGGVDLSAEMRPEQGLRVSGGAVLAGDDWRAVYAGGHLNHTLSVTAGDLSGFAGVTESSTTLGAVFQPGDAYFAATQTFSDRSEQRVDAGYRFRVSPELVLMPLVSGLRSAAGADVDLSAAFGLTATFDTSPLLGFARLEVPYPLDRGWRANAAVVTRTTEPIGGRADLAASPDGLIANVTVNEKVHPEVTLRQRLSYSDSASVSFGVGYRPLAEPVALDGYLGATFRGGDVGLTYQLAAAYRPSPFSVEASVVGDTLTTVTYRAGLSYEDRDWSAGVGYLHDEDEDRLDATLSGHGAGFSGRARYRYDLRTGRHSGSLSLSYQPERRYVLRGGLELGDELTWELALTAIVDGGFATPEPVVEAFGGLRTGTVKGAVFRDLDRDGTRGPGEPPVAAMVHAGRTSTSTDESGSYSLALAEGSYTIGLSGLPATLGIERVLRVAVTEGSVTEVDVPVVEVATAVVTVFSDDDRDGLRASTEQAVPGVAVTFRGSSGATRTVTTNERGEAVLQNAAPGTYTVYVDEASLPESVVATTPAQSLELAAGPITRLELGVAARPRETVRAFSSSDLALLARLGPMTAPPGADVLVTAELRGDFDPAAVYVEAALPGGEAMAMAPVGDGVYEVRVPVPPDARGVLLVTVRASAAETVREQVLPLVVADGPLATLRISPATTGPGEPLVAEASFLKLVGAASIVVDGVTLPLAATDDPYVFRAEVTAPAAPGAYDVVLLGDGEPYAESRFRVQ